MPNHINTTHPIMALTAVSVYGGPKSGDRQIAKALLPQLERIPRCTIQELSELCHVSVSTFHHFYKSIGYTSFAEFKVKMTDALETHVYKNPVVAPASIHPGEDPYDALLRETRDSVDAVAAWLDREALNAFAEEMHRASRIYIHDTYYSGEKLNLMSDLALVGKDTTLSIYTEGQRTDIESLDAECFLIACVNEPSRSREIEAEIPEAKARGARIGVLSLSPGFRYPELCDHLIEIARPMPRGDQTVCSLVFRLLSCAYRERFLSPV